MIHQEGHFKSTDATNLYYQSWMQSRDSKPDHDGIIAIVHGSGEHSGRYANVVNHFSELGYKLYAFDFRGHGKSAGRPGHVQAWQEYRDDLDCYLHLIEEENPGKPVFLYGHSMGGQIVLDYLTSGKHRAVAAVVCSAPAINPPPTSPLLIFVGKILTFIWPTISLNNGLDVNDISRDAAVIKAYVEDPLVSAKITARFAAEFLACIDRVQANADKIDVPLFLFHGSADRIIPMQGTESFYSKVVFADKKLEIYQGGFHEPHNDLQQQEVFRDIEKWLDSRLI